MNLFQFPEGFQNSADLSPIWIGGKFCSKFYKGTEAISHRTYDETEGEKKKLEDRRVYYSDPIETARNIPCSPLSIETDSRL